MQWDPVQKPAEAAEARLIAAILDGTFAIHANLPAERELCGLLGVTRPTLREALQRLSRDGWVEIRQGKPTRVRDYWAEGSLGVLGAIAQSGQHLPQHFVEHLLAVRKVLAPAYTGEAVARDPARVAAQLDTLAALDDTPEAFTQADWDLHHCLTLASGNPIYTLIFNGFRELYALAGPGYFAPPAARAHSRAFYADLLAAARRADAPAAQALTARVMAESLARWQSLS